GAMAAPPLRSSTTARASEGSQSMLHMPTYPARTAPRGEHWTLTLAIGAARCVYWLLLAAVVLVLIVVAGALCAFLPFLRGGR
ncbi:hypothetical protein, partial [Streptomyces celluloflavus]|uniref:hypothetical protein n=1 Tax=Streptomyces celluloflavus TaxID=58344 RepID=UPI003693AED0